MPKHKHHTSKSNGKANGKSNGHGALSADLLPPDLNDISPVMDAEVGPPPRLYLQDFTNAAKQAVALNMKHGEAKKAYTFYSKIEWDVWWDDFCSGTTKAGRLLYRNVSEFIKAKAKDSWQRSILWQLIGPKEKQEDKWRYVPWLGDWQKRRQNGFWSVDPEKMIGIRQAIKERQNAIDSARAIAPLTALQMQRWARLSQMIDEAFGGQPFLKDEAPTSPKNKKRFSEYVSMHKAAFALERTAWDSWMQCHGLNPNDAQAWVLMAGMLGAKAGVAGALAGVAAERNGQLGQLADGTILEVTQTDLLLAKNINAKSDMYPNLTVPDLVGEVSTSQRKM